jgi:hypothetical protein
MAHSFVEVHTGRTRLSIFKSSAPEKGFRRTYSSVRVLAGRLWRACRGGLEARASVVVTASKGRQRPESSQALDAHVERKR